MKILKILKQIVIGILYWIGWFLDNILFNIFLVLIYPLLFSVCWIEGYYSLKDRKFKQWKSHEDFYSNYWTDAGPIATFFISMIILGIVSFLILFQTFALIFYCVILLIVIAEAALLIYREKKEEKKKK